MIITLFIKIWAINTINQAIKNISDIILSNTITDSDQQLFYIVMVFLPLTNPLNITPLPPIQPHLHYSVFLLQLLNLKGKWSIWWPLNLKVNNLLIIDPIIHS